MSGRTIKTALVTVDYEGWYWDQLEKALQPANIIRADINDTKAMSEGLAQADVALLDGDLNDQIIAEGLNLNWIHCGHAGLAKSARPQIFERNIVLSGAAGRSAPVLAEHAFFLMLGLIYRMHDLERQQQAHQWVGGMYDQSFGLCGQTIGVIGMGHTGVEVAKRARAFNMQVLGYDLRPSEYVDEMYYPDHGATLAEMVAKCDFIVLAIGLNNYTHHLINKEIFDCMKPTARLINMARGALINEDDLIDALQNGKIAGAGCDTVTVEPLSPDSPLWDMDNVIITPHGTPQVPDRRAVCLDILCRNIELYRAGQPLINQLYERDLYDK